MTSRRARIVKQSRQRSADRFARSVLEQWYAALVDDYGRFVPVFQLHDTEPSPTPRRSWRSFFSS